MNALEIVKENRRQILAVAAKHGAGNVRLFGSVLRGQEQADSDIDLLVDMAPDHDLFDMVALSRELEELLHRKADVVTSDELSPVLRERIKKSAVEV
ncbi:MAG: nucleotidyltransferase family protein [Lentisphaerae bacterium]|jgi:predicted nucleotidyltransferase|nr:nucleotidyltransferase family protein [Lentisphaerota bacterium]